MFFDDYKNNEIKNFFTIESIT